MDRISKKILDLDRKRIKMRNNVTQVEFNLLKEYPPDDVFKPGEAVLIENGSLILCCPCCGSVGASAGTHKYDVLTQSYSPSINNRCCGWHGFLKNGKFINA